MVVLSIALALSCPVQAEKGDSRPGGSDDDNALGESQDDVVANESLNGWSDLPAKTFDLIILRPLRIGQITVGFVCFLPAAIFAGPSVGEVWQLFVMDAVESTFVTPLGEFGEDY